MLLLLLSLAASLAALGGGLIGLKNKDRTHRLLGFTAGVLISMVAFGLLPEIFALLADADRTPTGAMVALVCGFLGFHITEKSILLHQTNEAHYEVHHHPYVGVASALALIGHSFLDGVAIGLAFQAGEAVGTTVAIAVIAHRFSDGLNTVNLMLINRQSARKAFVFLAFAAAAPLFGALTTLLFNLSETSLVLYLGFFAGFLLYIAASEILPEAHSKHSSYKTIALTVLGVVFMFAVTRFA